ncbi:ABC transporter ATP-binding protein [Rhodococcus sp. IEGM 248]|nr:ABC transporter ATP-binding protein [Rhodococcus sp. IEGM 248]
MTMLEVRNLKAGYGTSQVLHGVDVSVQARQVYSICGPNGAGKSTLLKAIARVIDSTSEALTLDGQSLTRSSAYAVVRKGIALCPEGRCVFPRMSTEANLQVGAYTRKDRTKVKHEIDEYFDLWPVIARRRHSAAGLLSGGEQQIVAIGRALLSAPSLLLLDEPSLGLAPVLIDQVYEGLNQLVSNRDMSVLLVEQNVAKAMALSERVAVLSSGRIVYESLVADTNPDVVGQHYFHAASDALTDVKIGPARQAQAQ